VLAQTAVRQLVGALAGALRLVWPMLLWLVLLWCMLGAAWATLRGCAGLGWDIGEMIAERAATAALRSLRPEREVAAVMKGEPPLLQMTRTLLTQVAGQIEWQAVATWAAEKGMMAIANGR